MKEPDDRILREHAASEVGDPRERWLMWIGMGGPSTSWNHVMRVCHVLFSNRRSAAIGARIRPSASLLKMIAWTSRLCVASRSPSLSCLLNKTRCLSSKARMEHRVFIGFGSNLGDRVAAIEHACNAMDATDGIRLLRTSSLWETKPMYMVDQGDFVNGACEVNWASIT